MSFKVRCIRDDLAIIPIWLEVWLSDYVKVGNVYTVHSTGYQPDGMTIYMFDEVTFPYPPFGFPSICFVPITDISSLEALLNTQPTPERTREFEDA